MKKQVKVLTTKKLGINMATMTGCNDCACQVSY